MRVAGDSAYCTVTAGGVIVLHSFCAHLQCGLQRVPTALREKIVGVGKGQIRGAGDIERIWADQHHMVRVLHHRAGGADGVARAKDAAHRTGGAGGTVHDGSVHFLFALGGEHRPAPRVEQRCVLQCAYGGSHRVNRTAP